MWLHCCMSLYGKGETIALRMCQLIFGKLPSTAAGCHGKTLVMSSEIGFSENPSLVWKSNPNGLVVPIQKSMRCAPPVNLSCFLYETGMKSHWHATGCGYRIGLTYCVTRFGSYAAGGCLLVHLPGVQELNQ